MISHFKVMIVGTAKSGKGGISTVLRAWQNSSLWEKYHCYWLETQIQAGYLQKIYYCIKAYILAMINIWRYDIIHFHTVPGISMVTQLPVFIMAIAGRKKIITHIHVGNQIEDYKNNRLFHFYINHSNLMLLLTQTWCDKFKSLSPNSSTPVDFLYNPYLPVNSIDYSHRDKTIIFAGTLNQNKAYDILLQGFEKISAKHPDWKLIIMGNGEEKKARELALQLNISDKVVVTGHVSGSEKESYFQNASIFCLCSYKEGFPMVVLEAWAYGIPVLTTPVGGLPEVIEENKNACYFDFGDYHQLADRLDMLISNPEMRAQMASYSKQYAAERFTMRSIETKLSSIYNTI